MYGAKGKTGGYYTNAGYTSKEADGEKGDYVVWAPRYPQPLPNIINKSVFFPAQKYIVQKLCIYVVEYKTAWQ